MPFEHNLPVLLVGGYGVVGQKITHLLAERHPELNLWLGGRNPAIAAPVIGALNNVSVVEIDIAQLHPLRNLERLPRAVICVTNDPDDHLLNDCIENGIPFLDITRWTSRLTDSVAASRVKKLSSPVIFSSGWMAGNAALLASSFKKEFHYLTSIDIDILFAMADNSGPNSLEYMDRLTTPFLTIENGERQRRTPLTGGKNVVFSTGYRCKVYRFDIPDQATLPTHLDVGTVNARIAFDSAWMMVVLVCAQKSGLLRLLSKPRFDGLRRQLMHNPGHGAPHEIMLSLTGTSAMQEHTQMTVSVRAPQGQTHLTACGAVIQLEWLLGLGDIVPAPAGIHYAEQHPAPDLARQFLLEQGVEISTTIMKRHKA